VKYTGHVRIHREKNEKSVERFFLLVFSDFSL
jgi:hypothetical protein